LRRLSLSLSLSFIIRHMIILIFHMHKFFFIKTHTKSDTFVDFPDNIISDNYKNALADLLEKEVEEEEDNGSGGMLLGVDLDVFDIGAIEEGDFFIKEMDITGIRSKEIISKLDEIDKRAESVPLSTSDGTKGRRKNRIFQMHNGDRMLYEDREYYKDLFGPPERLANGDWKTVETKFERNLCPTKRGARENRLFQITKNIGWQDGIKWLNVAIIKDLFMSKGTFQVKDGSQTAKISISSKNSTVAFVFSTDQDTFGLVIGGLGFTDGRVFKLEDKISDFIGILESVILIG
ncbi:hypothetical protein ACJX0J_028380, partial [Zea mays]